MSGGEIDDSRIADTMSTNLAATYTEVVHLLLYGRLPTHSELPRGNRRAVGAVTTPPRPPFRGLVGFTKRPATFSRIAAVAVDLSTLSTLSTGRLLLQFAK